MVLKQIESKKMKIKVLLKNGKSVIADTEKWVMIYESGRFSTQGVKVYLTPKKRLIAVPWSRWQGADPQPYEIYKDDFLDFPHYERVINALETAQLTIKIEDI